MTTDNAGNAFTSSPITVRVDNTNPTGSVTAPAAGANVRGTIGLASDSADSGSGVASTQFQRSPAGAGAWTSQAASWNTTLQADGQYDLRVVTTDNAGNTLHLGRDHDPRRQHRPTGSLTAPANGAEIGDPTCRADEQLRRLRLRRRHRRLRAQPRGRRHLVGDAGELEHGERPRRRRRR